MGKEKMNPPTEEIAVLMEAEPGEKGKYLLMAGIAVLGIGLLFVLPPLGVSVLFASMVGNGLMHGRESKKLESALKAVWRSPLAQPDSQGTWKGKKFPDWKCIRSVWKNRKNNSVRLQENAEHL